MSKYMSLFWASTMLAIAGCAMFNEAPPKPKTYDPDELVEYGQGSGPMKECWMITKEQADRILENLTNSMRAY